MDWAIGIFLGVAGITAGSLWWWCACEVEKAGRAAASGNNSPAGHNATRQ